MNFVSSLVWAASASFADIVPFDGCPDHGIIVEYPNSISAIVGRTDPSLFTPEFATHGSEIRGLEFSYGTQLLVTFLGDDNADAYCIAYVGILDDAPTPTVSAACVLEIDAEFFYATDAFALFEGGAQDPSDGWLFTRSNTSNTAPSPHNARSGENTSEPIEAKEGWYTIPFVKGEEGREFPNAEQTKLNVSTTANDEYYHDIAFHPKSNRPEAAIAFTINQAAHLIRVQVNFIEGTMEMIDLGKLPSPEGHPEYLADGNVFSAVWFRPGINNWLYAIGPAGDIISWRIRMSLDDTANLGVEDVKKVMTPNLTIGILHDGATCYVPGEIPEDEDTTEDEDSDMDGSSGCSKPDKPGCQKPHCPCGMGCGCVSCCCGCQQHNGCDGGMRGACGGH